MTLTEKPSSVLRLRVSSGRDSPGVVISDPIGPQKPACWAWPRWVIGGVRYVASGRVVLDNRKDPTLRPSRRRE